MLGRASIRRRAQVLLATAALIIAAYGGATLFATVNLRNTYIDVRNARADLADVDQLSIGMANQELAVRSYLETGQPAYLQPYSSGAAEVYQARRAIEGDALDPEAADHLARTEAAVADWQNWASVGIAATAQKGSVTDSRDLAEGKRRFEVFRSEESKLAGLFRQRLAVARARADRVYVITLVAAAAGGVALVLLLILSAILAFRSVLRPLVVLAQAARRVARGQTAVIPGTHRVDEVGELSRALAALQQAYYDKGYFISLVSHDFRTALTGIQGFSEMIRDEEVSLGEAKEFAADIHRDSVRLDRLIGQLLELDAMESGRLDLELGPVDLNSLVDKQAQHVAERHPRRPLRVDLASGLRPINGDARRLIQLLDNLVRSAMSHSPDGSPIDLATVAANGHAEIQVRDHGEGIPAEAIPSLFDRYHLIRITPERRSREAGLGLALVRQIAEMHGGSVAVESPEGAGALFTVSLPLAETKP